MTPPIPTRRPIRGPNPRRRGPQGRLPLALRAEALGARALGVALAWTLLLPAAGCSYRAAEDRPPRPSAYRVEIRGLGEIGPYLEADLAGRIVARDGSFRHFYFPRTDECRRALAYGGEVQYRPDGSFGLLESAAGDRCRPNGIGSLAAWRDHRGTLRSQPLPERDQAEYEPVAAGETQLLVRGRFPLALELRWPEPMDTIAVLPDSEACQSIFRTHEATMEYRTKGEPVFFLEGEEGRCPIVGFLVPVESDASVASGPADGEVRGEGGNE